MRMQRLVKIPAAVCILLLACAVAQCAETTAPAVLRVMTYNMHVGQGTDGNFDLRRIADVITSASADIVALQEVDMRTRRSGGVDQLAELVHLTGMHGRFGKGREYQGGDYGQAILSRWPIGDFKVHPLPGPTVTDERIAMSARITPGGTLPPFLFVATHIHHQSEEFRVAQVQQLHRALAAEGESSTTAILVGDMNAEPGSKAMDLLLREWSDALPNGELTYPSKEPIKKIDWILLRRGSGWRVRAGKVIPEKVASDHRPVVAELEFPGSAGVSPVPQR